jgi:hypothetical protein
MRDYFLHPAQTNLELYAQAIEGGYSRTSRQELSSAYHFALQQVFPLARGSGKPFIAHLVGTASLVMASGGPEDWVIGALLHAVYQRRIPFRHGLAPDERRGLLADRFGAAVDDLVHRYTSFESEDLRHCPPHLIASASDVLTLRLADELEDLCGHALALHGTTSTDGAGVQGSYLSRRDAKLSEAQSLLGLTDRLGLQGIHRGFVYWLDFASTPGELRDMRTGWVSSVDLSADG